MEFEKIVEIIESRREALKSREEEIEVVDYGAGSPRDKRTKEEMEKGVVCKISLQNLAKIGVKREKAQEILKIFKNLNPKVILELGTCCGFSSSYMSYFAQNSRIYTIEGSESVAEIARENHKEFGLLNIEVLVGRFELVLPTLLERIAPLDFAFIDGHHDKFATWKYFHSIRPFMRKGGVMLFDDIAWSDGMQDAWEEITKELKESKCKEVSIVGCDAWKMGVVWL
ncbi:class I SAM-dependent methyltransferase [Helicobacter turcicus]|uniref:Class I SAM-dependent methyltransferase n=1 Tax=Helicobacter turcicus TaxID=2867412 RepID=A0ABS7JQ49_9HELI|nr:class I SAM-dependent methyltransferase [Helicobacter turcicus]MBX7491495.1 class I SAM-dependent methyltransferase [Helicobacter turcicus]MBX7546351.1 class I SAM-dependent methyltransferase [Helicobacter turcicus]